MARFMTNECGMSEIIGPIYLGRDPTGLRSFCEDLESRVDEDASRCLKSYARVIEYLMRPSISLLPSGFGKIILAAEARTFTLFINDSALRSGPKCI